MKLDPICPQHKHTYVTDLETWEGHGSGSESHRHIMHLACIHWHRSDCGYHMVHQPLSPQTRQKQLSTTRPQVRPPKHSNKEEEAPRTSTVLLKPWTPMCGTQ